MSMNVSNEKTVSVLQNLIETNRDGQHGFRTAAEDAKDAELGRVFTQFSTQRTTFIAELQDRIRSLGGDPDKSGSVAGSLHRGWIDLKSALMGSDDHAILVEAERGEDSTVKNYRDALSKDLPSDIRSVIERQYREVLAAHNVVKSLRDGVTSTMTTAGAPRAY